MTEPMRRSLKIPILIFTVFIIAILIGYMGYFNEPEPPKIGKGKNNTNMTNPRIIGVKSFSDRNVTPPEWWPIRTDSAANAMNGSTANATNRSGFVTYERPLPYPRVMINYSTQAIDMIGSENAGDKNIFLVLTLEIRNYGYKYFDAHPSKFIINRGGAKIYPVMNVSTDNMLDVVIPNNSRGKGDLIFLVGERETYIGRSSIEYLSKNDYKILYNQISSEDMNRVEKDEEEETDNTNEEDYYID